jgi:hypothetical protein
LGYRTPAEFEAAWKQEQTDPSFFTKMGLNSVQL